MVAPSTPLNAQKSAKNPFSFIVDPAVPGRDRYASTHLYDYRHALLCNGLLLFANDSNISAS